MIRKSHIWVYTHITHIHIWRKWKQEMKEMKRYLHSHVHCKLFTIAKILTDFVIAQFFLHHNLLFSFSTESPSPGYEQGSTSPSLKGDKTKPVFRDPLLPLVLSDVHAPFQQDCTQAYAHSLYSLILPSVFLLPWEQTLIWRQHSSLFNLLLQWPFIRCFATRLKLIIFRQFWHIVEPPISSIFIHFHRQFVSWPWISYKWLIKTNVFISDLSLTCQLVCFHSTWPFGSYS